MEEKKNLEVVAGDGSNLNISPVYEHLNVAKPKSAEKKPTNIVVPKEKNKKNAENDKNKSDSNSTK